MSDAERWLDDHGGAMYAYARLRLGDDSSAEDAVQEALLAALTAERKGGSSERTWLIGILRHKVLDAIRREARARPLDVREALGEGRKPFVLGLWRRKQTEEAARAVDGLGEAELRAALRGALAELPEAMRRVVVLREIDGLDTETVSKVLGLSATHVWTLTHRAKVRLRETLEDRAAQQRGEGRSS